MAVRIGRRGSAGRLFAIYATASLVPVLGLGVVLAGAYRHDAAARGLAEGRSEAALVAQTAIEPQLGAAALTTGLSAAERAELHKVVTRGLAADQVVRIRLRDQTGRVVFSDDGSGMRDVPDGEVEAAEHGRVLAKLTRLNADSNDAGPLGKRVIEVYRPLQAGTPPHQVGVLEVYLPYAPIARDVSAGLHTLYRDLALGLAALYLLLAAISASITGRLRRQSAHNAYLAEHDLLTGLPNRAGFHERIAEALADPAGAAVALLDLDRFKEVNDTLGHHNGDQLLAELGQRLAAAVRPQDTVARLGGDEFGVVLAAVSDETEATAILTRLRHELEAEVEVNGLPLIAEASIGFALAPADGADGDTLLQEADIAMYVAKAGGTGVVRYDPTQDHYDATKLGLIGELRRALTRDELLLHYQPKASVATGEILAVEALIRWEHPKRGLIYPDAFLPIAEQTGLIEPLTAWVLRHALGQLRRWGTAGDALSVAVNISARSLARADFADRVFAALREAQVLPHRLLLEITETALVADPQRAALALARLDAAGVRVSLDDFGRGQTSLGYLSQLPLRELKIDKGFVLDMLEVPAHAAIVHSIIGLGHNLGFKVVAEGVESEPVLAELAAAGCDVVQGYLLARPMPAEQLPGWLTTHRAGEQAAASA